MPPSDDDARRGRQGEDGHGQDARVPRAGDRGDAAPAAAGGRDRSALHLADARARAADGRRGGRAHEGARCSSRVSRHECQTRQNGTFSTHAMRGVPTVFFVVFVVFVLFARRRGGARGASAVREPLSVCPRLSPRLVSTSQPPRALLPLSPRRGGWGGTGAQRGGGSAVI